MSATTSHYAIPYPEKSDQIKLIPDQLKALADKTDTALYGTAVRHGSSLANIDTADANIGQQAYVTTTVENEMSEAGPYYYYGRQWVRPAFPAVIFQLVENDDWAIETWQWQTFGQPYLYVRAKAKRDVATTATNREWTLGNFTQDAYKPPTYAHFPAYTNEEHAANFGFQIAANRGLILETFTIGFTFKAGNIVYAMLTWPCASVGSIRKAIMN